jgi:hypothetical protein
MLYKALTNRLNGLSTGLDSDLSVAKTQQVGNTDIFSVFNDPSDQTFDVFNNLQLSLKVFFY